MINYIQTKACIISITLISYTYFMYSPNIKNMKIVFMFLNTFIDKHNILHLLFITYFIIIIKLCNFYVNLYNNSLSNYMYILSEWVQFLMNIFIKLNDVVGSIYVFKACIFVCICHENWSQTVSSTRQTLILKYVPVRLS